MSSQLPSEDGSDVYSYESVPAPLAHRTDRFAIRNDTNDPIVFVDTDPLFSLATDPDALKENPLKTNMADIRNQHYGIEVDDLSESETAIREILDRFDADTDRRFYYTLAGDHAQIGGNGLDDYFEAIDNFRTIYTDLIDQMGSFDGDQHLEFPERAMRGRCIGVVSVEGVWLQFSTYLTETPDQEFYSHTSLSLTTVEQHGPLKAMWLRDRLDHPTVGSPSAVDRQYTETHAKLPVGRGPLRNVKEHRLIGYLGRDETVEYISCDNPYYRGDDSEYGEQCNRLEEAGVPRDVIHKLVSMDRLLLRPKGGSHGVDEDVYVSGNIELTKFANVTLLSGKVMPIREEKFQRQEARKRNRREKNNGILNALRP